MLVEHTNQRTGETTTLENTDNPYPNGLPETASPMMRYGYWLYMRDNLIREIGGIRHRSKQRQELKNKLDGALRELNIVRRKVKSI